MKKPAPPNPILGLHCAGCGRFVDNLIQVEPLRYRCAECASPIGLLIERSSIGSGLKNIRENGIEAELRDLENEGRKRL